MAITGIDNDYYSAYENAYLLQEIDNVKTHTQTASSNVNNMTSTNSFSNKNVIKENDKISNDYLWKSNEYVGEDCVGRSLDLTSLINKADGYMQGSLSDAGDVDYYKFNISEYRILSAASDKYNLDITITLDHIPEGCDYELILYDEAGNQVGIASDNGNGGKSITIPNWNMENRIYTVKVQAKDGSPVNPEEYYYLSFQTEQADENNVLKQQIKEMSEYGLALRQKLHDGQDASEEKQALLEIREKYEVYYIEQMEKLHMEQAKEYLHDAAIPDKDEISGLLEKMAAGEKLTDQEKGLINIFSTAQEMDAAKASAELNSTLLEKICTQMENVGIDFSQYSFTMQIGVDGQMNVEGIDDEALKTKMENIFAGYSDKLINTYFTIDSDIQDLTEKERYILRAAVDVEKFLYKAANGNVSLDDLAVENGKIKGLPANLDMLINHPGENLTYMNYQEDIIAIKNYEQTQHKNILSGLNMEFCVENGMIQIKK